MSQSFASLGLSPQIQRAVEEQGYTTPTPVQAQAIPLILSGRDLLAGAQTGTGKTAGFTLPLLERLSVHASSSTSPAKHPVRALILTPTRELAAQVEESVKTYGKYVGLRSTLIYGGVAMDPQIAELRRGIEVLVATPGRLLDHLTQKTVDLRQVEILVLDEADRMLDMGFIRDMRKIFEVLPKKRQNLLFSATFSDEIRKLADSMLNDPALVEVARRNSENELITHRIHLVEQHRKRALLERLVREGDWKQVLVFTRTRQSADRLTSELARDGIDCAAIHGDKTQGARTQALDDFKQGKVRLLIATDVAARGLDIEQLPHVVNFELPNVPEDYVHRIGRTGRAGATGEAISLVSPDEMGYLQEIEKLLGRKLDRAPLPASLQATPAAPKKPAPEEIDPMLREFPPLASEARKTIAPRTGTRPKERAALLFGLPKSQD